jgi:hypothetical protein
MSDVVVRQIANLEEFMAAVRQTCVDWDSRGLFWRGQQSNLWDLVPKLYRTNGSGDPVFPAHYEANFVLHFMQKASVRYLHCPAPDDFVGWLTLMQHHGLPTRLLDWSRSPLIAAFFVIYSHYADRKGLGSDPGAIWVLNPDLLNESQIGMKAICMAASGTVMNVAKGAFAMVTASPDVVCAALLREIDPRMMVQQAAFTLHGTRTPLNKLPNAKAFVRRFDIQPSLKAELIRELDVLGFDESDLFPDLDHLARELGRTKFKPVFCAPHIPSK